MRTVKVCLFLFEIFVAIACRSQDSLLIDSRDGKKYRTVTIGNQTWMAENLKYRLKINEKPLEFLKSSVEKPFYYVDSAFNKRQEYFYNWKAAQKACPIGWHLPKKEDIDSLLLAVSKGDRKEAYKSLIEGGVSKFGVILTGLFISGNFKYMKFQGYNKVAFFHLASRKKYDEDDRPVYSDFWILSSSREIIKVSKGLVEDAYSVRCLKEN